MTEEIWKPIEGFDNYEVSDLGNIKNAKTGRILKQNQRKSGYLCVGLRSSGEDKTLSCHRLVALAYLPNPENKPQVDHIDRFRNNNKLSNLRWATVQEQALNRSYIGHYDIKRRRSIWKCDKETGERIELFESSTLASQSVVHTTSTTNACAFIFSVARGDNPRAYGFKWEFDDEVIIEGEEWKEIDSFILGVQRKKSKYFISNKGRLRTPRRGTITPRLPTDKGYPIFTIYKTIFTAHRLVALMFLERQEGRDIVNHIDGKKWNCTIDNLEWVTESENVIHAYATGLHPEIIDVCQYELSGKFIQKFPSLASAAREVNVDTRSISRAVSTGYTHSGFQWKSRVGDTQDINPIEDTRFKNHILQYTLSGEFVHEYNSTRSASRTLGICSSAILTASKKQGCISGKFQWRKKYSDIPLTVIESDDIRYSPTPIKQFSLDGKFIAEYPSIGKTMKATGLGKHVLKKYSLSGKPYKGYKWVRVDKKESKKRKRDE